MRVRALAVAWLLVPGLASAQPYTFVSTPASDALAVVDLSTHMVVDTIPFGGGLPSGCAVGPHGKRLYAVLSQSNALARIDMATGAVLMVPVGARPSGVAAEPSGRRVYVANTAADTVSVVDAERGVVVATIPVGDAPTDVVAGAHRLYVANWAGGTVSVVDTDRNTLVAEVPVGRFPSGLALHRTTRRLYVANFFDDTVSVIDTAALSVVRTIPVARSPRALALDAAGQRLYVASFDDSRVQMVDPATGTVTLEAASGGLNPMDLMFGPDGTRLYVAHLQEMDGVVALDATTLAPVTSVDVAAGPMAFAGLSATRPPAPLRARWARAARALFAPPTAPAAEAEAVAAREPLGDEVLISDAQFDVADWTVTVVGAQATTQEATDGNPGAWRRTTHFGQGETTHRFVRPGSTYNPISQGAVDRIDVSWDRRLFAETIASERFVVVQNNVVYRTSERSFFSPAWENDQRAGLRADAFDNGSGGRPDFSEKALPISFGYVRRTFNQTVPHGIDNFTVTIHRSPPNLAGRLAFQKTAEVVEESDTPFVWVDRRDGALGAVTVDLTTLRPNGTTIVETLSWADGDSFPKNILVVSLGLPPGAGARTARVTMGNVTGGAIIDADRASLPIVVFPEEWPPVLQQLFLRLQGLFGAWSPAWLLALALPAVLLMRRRAAGHR
jgi:YVTN family beta-propeller protein